MPKSILEAIKLGLWEFEPSEVPSEEYDATGNMPGTREKLDVLADRIANGEPLWHPSDREDIEDPDPCESRPCLRIHSLRTHNPRTEGLVNHGLRKPR